MPVDIQRALIDPEYRKSLTKEELAEVAAHGDVPQVLGDEDLKGVAGGLEFKFNNAHLSSLALRQLNDKKP